MTQTEIVELEPGEPGDSDLPEIETVPITIHAAPPIEYKEFSDAKSMRSHIFQKKDIEEEIIDVPEWEIKILVKGMTGKQRASVMKACMSMDGQSVDIEKMYALTIINGCRHPGSKEMIFSPADQQALMGEKSGGVIERLSMAVMRVSGLDGTANGLLAKN